MAVAVREQDRDLMQEAELPGRIVEEPVQPLARLLHGQGVVGSRSQIRFGVRQRVAQLHRVVAIAGPEVIDDEVARDAA